MKKRIITLLLAATMVLSLTACTKQKEVPVVTIDTQDEVIDENTETESEPADTEEVVDDDTQINLADANDLNEEATARLAEALDAIYNVRPGAAGSSLRGTIAIGEIIDLGEYFADSTDETVVIAAIAVWMQENLTDDIERDNFMECYDSAKSGVVAYYEDPSILDDTIDDCGYELQNVTYHQEYGMWILACIDAALE